MGLSPTAKKFILHWGEMASRWGVNRTVAQIHALLFVSPEPLNAEQLTELLSVSRSNVSTSLRELQGWGVIRVVHVMGDRRDHFECVSEVWDMFQAILDERKRRVIDPAIDVLRETIAQLNPVLRVWGGYFRTGNAATTFLTADAYVHWRLKRLLVKRHGRQLRPGQAAQWTPDFFHALGLHRLRGTIRYPEAV